VPAFVTLPDGTHLGSSGSTPAKVFLHSDDTLEVYTQDAQSAPIVLSFSAKLSEEYTGGFNAAVAMFKTVDGIVDVRVGPGCSCGFAIKAFAPAPHVEEE
jgi:hypothetical protein